MAEDGREIVSPLEYETNNLLGANCGLHDPNEVALRNEIANDLGVDTIEIGGLFRSVCIWQVGNWCEEKVHCRHNHCRF